VTGLRLETTRLVLRMPRLDDAPAAAELLGDPEVMRFLGGETVPAEDVVVVVQKWLDRWELNGVGPFVIERREDGRWVGRTGVLVWDSRTWTHASFAESGEYAQPEIGWALAREHWGNGYATEAAGAVRDWARRDRGFERLISLIAPDNMASLGVAERLGAQPAETVKLFDSGDAVVWVHA
jgi:RimJ/RimL family protein N-acetyltransferase